MIYLLIHIFIWSAAAQDTLQEPVLPDTLQQQESFSPDTLDMQPGFSSDTLDTLSQIQPEAEEKEPVIVMVWSYENRPGYQTAETDSTLRWVNILDLSQHYHRRPGSITYRTGTLGRQEGINHHTYENRHFETEMDGLLLNDPLTGAVNWSHIPIHKIRTFQESDFGPVYKSEIRLRDHYLLQPRTYLNFDESSYNYRNLEFSATHNVTPKTNLEISYWDRRDAIGYSRSSVEGNQIVLKGYHQLSQEWLVRAAYITNSLDQEEPFGYVLENPSLFRFNPFTATPRQSSASSEEGGKDIYLHAHFRSDSVSTVQTQLGLHYQTDTRSLQFNADTVATDFRKIEFYGRQILNPGPAKISATFRPYFLENRTEQLTENSWFGIRGDIESVLNLSGSISISGHASGKYRSDARYEIYAGGNVDLEIGSGVQLSTFAGFSDRSPDIQALYWQSNTFSGDPGLQNEQSVTAGAEVRVGLGRWFSLEGRGDAREVQNGVFVNPSDPSGARFVNIDPYTSYSATGALKLNSSIFEGMAGATYKTFESSASQNPVNQGLQASGDRAWLKGSLYWKNYLFDRATYVKAGIVGMYSPNFMRGAEYIAPLNRWQHGTEPLLNPPFSRVDIDVSARIRWFMVLLRWENIFDRVTQAGYFETVGYPMPEQRFILGFRVLFTN